MATDMLRSAQKTKKNKTKNCLAYMRGYFELQVMSLELCNAPPPIQRPCRQVYNTPHARSTWTIIMMSAILSTPTAQCKHNEPQLPSHQYVGIVFLFCHWEQRHEHRNMTVLNLEHYSDNDYKGTGRTGSNSTEKEIFQWRAGYVL